MPLLSWNDFLDLHSRAHLIVARYNPAEKIRKGKRTRIALLRLFVAGVEPAGDYAITGAKKGELHLALERGVDAARIKAALGARATAQVPGWTTQAAFQLDEAAYEKIGNTLDRTTPLR